MDHTFAFYRIFNLSENYDQLTNEAKHSIFMPRPIF
jgi:hypothetical protein